ncbi:MAG: hypothetical protein RR056_02935 [Acetivibrio sp.]
MKKGTLLMGMGILSSCLLMGCKSGSTNLDAKNLENMTLSVNKAGNIQMGMVESFDKSYYDETELKNYLEEVITEYNKTAGKNAVKMSSFFVENKRASAVFVYDQMKNYKELNETKGEYLSLEEAKSILPDILKTPKGEEKTVDEILAETDSKKYKVLFIEEEYDVIVDGKVKYYSNGECLNEESVHTPAADTSVIIFK